MSSFIWSLSSWWAFWLFSTYAIKDFWKLPIAYFSQILIAKQNCDLKCMTIGKHLKFGFMLANYPPPKVVPIYTAASHDLRGWLLLLSVEMASHWILILFFRLKGKLTIFSYVYEPFVFFFHRTICSDGIYFRICLIVRCLESKLFSLIFFPLCSQIK